MPSGPASGRRRSGSARTRSESRDRTALRIEISALTPLVPITADQIVIGQHGLIIAHAEHSGLLLPQVAAERGWSTETFLAQLCRKADLPADAWQAVGAVLHGFEAEIWKEE